MAKAITIEAPPELIGKPRVDFIHSEFDALVWAKGDEVLLEKAVRCPCKSKGADNNSDCQNCKGTGWVFINTKKTRMLLTAMNLSTKFKEWSEEKVGTILITARDIDSLQFMDRITATTNEVIFSEVLFPVVYNNILFAFTVYNINDIEEVFMFQSSSQPLKKLIKDVDYSFVVGENKVVFNSAYKSITNFTVSVRYRHYLQFHVVDITREVRNTYVRQTDGSDKNIEFPVSAVGRRTHYVLDASNFSGSSTFDNSYNI